MKKKLIINEKLTLNDLSQIADFNCNIQLGKKTYQNLDKSYDVLKKLIQEENIIYGVTTGYGPLAENYIHQDQNKNLSKKLIYHLCSGVGPLFSRREVRAIIAVRIANLIQGWSGINPKIVNFLIKMLNQDIIPAVPEMGTVGASGDLTPLAHIALVLLGEGEVLASGTQRSINTEQAFREKNLTPIELKNKDGLALVNGTSAMTGIAALNGVDTKKAIDLLLKITICYAEILQGYTEAWNPAIAQARPHLGQKMATAQLYQLSKQSRRLKQPDEKRRRLPEFNKQQVVKNQILPQDPYSIRCTPQELGAAIDALNFHNQIVEQEINSSCDNPIIDATNKKFFHAGNFYGQHVAYVSDLLSNVVIKLALFSERAIARITDQKYNLGLPPFLTGGNSGLDSGLMGCQVTATALVAEMRCNATPASIQSIPTNANNQDVVTMGTIAARRCRDLLKILWKILSIEALTMAQGMELTFNQKSKKSDYCQSSQDLYDFVRKEIPFLSEDRPLSKEIELLATKLRTKEKTG